MRRRASRASSVVARSSRSVRWRSSSTNLGLPEEAAGWFERSLELHPEYLAAGLDLASLLLAQPDADPDAVLERLDAYPHDELTWYLFLGTAFYERGHAEHGERLLRRCLAIGEGHAAARVGLLEALVTQHRYAEVESELGELAEGTPGFVAAQRLRMLAADARRRPRRGRSPRSTRSPSGGGDAAEIAMLHAVDRGRARRQRAAGALAPVGAALARGAARARAPRRVRRVRADDRRRRAGRRRPPRGDDPDRRALPAARLLPARG